MSDQRKRKWLGKKTITEAKELWRITWPTAIQMTFENLIPFINLVIVGQKSNTAELAAAGLSMSFMNVFGLGIGFGLGAAYDTLGANANGFGDKKLVGHWLQRAVLILGLAMLPMWGVWMNAEGILLALRFDEEIARLVGRYCLVTIPYLPALFGGILGGKFFQVQGIVRPMMYIGLFTNTVHAIVCYVLVFTLDMGLDGSSLALSIGGWTYVSSVCFVVLKMGVGKECWHGWSAECFRDWGVFLKLALPGLLMVCFEIWAFEVCLIVSGTLGTSSLATQTSVATVTSVTFMLCLGNSIGASVRIGNLLGQGDAKTSKISANITLTIAFAIGAVMALFYGTLGVKVVELFSDDPGVLDKAHHIMWAAALFQISDSMQAGCSGILRGSGRQALGTIVNFVGFWILGIPTGIALAFPGNFGLLGLWIGLFISLTSQAIIMMYFVYKTDWDEQVRAAAKRCKSDGGGVDVLNAINNNDNNDVDDVDVDDDDDVALIQIERAVKHTTSDARDSNTKAKYYTDTCSTNIDDDDDDDNDRGDDEDDDDDDDIEGGANQIGMKTKDSRDSNRLAIMYTVACCTLGVGATVARFFAVKPVGLSDISNSTFSPTQSPI